MKPIFVMMLGGLFWLFSVLPAGLAAPKVIKEKVLFIPHDSRPISNEQTADTLRKMGWDIIVPPEEMLGGRDNLGNPDRLWEWLETNAKHANAAVISSDSMLYGSLVASRKHNCSENVLFRRVNKFSEFKQKHPQIDLYVFGSIMRTPRSGERSGSMEPGYYDSYGADIFRYTALSDKKEVNGLTTRESKEYDFLTKLIPQAAMNDWISRRQKNFRVSKALIDLARQNTFAYFVLGRDDNAPYSQTHMESRHLADYGKTLGDTRFQTMAGIDEFGMLMLTRAVNNISQSMPFVFVRYNWGRGENTIPAYSDEPISKSVRDHIVAAGGVLIQSPKNADLVLVVNTNPNGKTLESNDSINNGRPREGTNYCADIVKEYISAGYPVGLSDIAFANGADNALMEVLKRNGLLFKLRAYSGWNTATNSTGFVLGQGMLSSKMTDEARDALLMMRYLDDWAYQANIRGVVARQLGWFRASGAYSSLGDKKKAIEARTTSLMRRFADENLPPQCGIENLEITFPWNRMFEARFDLEKHSVLHRR